MRNDCKIYDIKKDLKLSWLDGKLIQVPNGNNFNFGYVIFIPNNIKNNTTLIIEGSNTGKGSSNTLKEGNEIMEKEGLYPSLPIYSIANELGLPVLYPLFPRINNGEEGIYTHMLSSNSLNSNTKQIKELGLERVDLQLIEMFKDAKERLREDNITIDDKFIIDGFSASAKFANRFTLLHPELVKLCIAGGVSGVLTLPVKRYYGENLLYPIGLGDFNTDVEEFKKVRQFYYMGEEDNQNDPFIFNEEGKAKYKGIITTEELIQMYKIFGKDPINDRWPKTQEIYNDLGINSKFKTYPGYKHDPRCATEDVKEEIKNILEIDKELTI